MRRAADNIFASDLTRRTTPITASPRISREVADAYQAVAGDPRYAHFVNIPDRIIRCLNYFGIPGDREPIRTCLHSYYLFIGVVDNAIDNGELTSGKHVLDHLASRTPPAGEPESTVLLVTEVLKYQIPEHCRTFFWDKLQALYQQVLNERAVTTIDTYIDCRITVGSLTAELSYLLIRPHLDAESEVLCRLMKQVGAVGCLVDSLIDLKSDYGLGLLAFTPTPARYVKLMSRTIRLGLRITLTHPLLSLLFLQAIFDNVRDRLRNQRCVDGRALVSNEKDQAASVA